MTRKPGWNSRLVAVVDAFRRQPLAYGQADCAQLAAAAIEAVTGDRPGKPEWYAYADEAGALAILNAEGFATLADLAASLLPEIHPSQATLGDIAAIPVDGPFGFALGVVSGPRIFVFGAPYDGLGTVDLLMAKRAFRVG